MNEESRLPLEQQVTLLGGDITLSVADVDLVDVSLRVLLASAGTLDRLEQGVDTEGGPRFASGRPRNGGGQS